MLVLVCLELFAAMHTSNLIGRRLATVLVPPFLTTGSRAEFTSFPLGYLNERFAASKADRCVFMLPAIIFHSIHGQAQDLRYLLVAAAVLPQSLDLFFLIGSHEKTPPAR